MVDSEVRVAVKRIVPEFERDELPTRGTDSSDDGRGSAPNTMLRVEIQ